MVKSACHIQAQPPYLARCVTCCVSRRFYTVQGANGFRFEHSDHEVTVQGPREVAQANTRVEQLKPRPAEYTVENEEENGRDVPSVVNLGRLDVRVRPSDADGSLHFEVTGSAPEGGFSVDFPLARAREAREFLKAGSFVVAKKGEIQEFRWTDGCIRAGDGGSQVLGIRSEEVARDEREEAKTNTGEQRAKPEPEAIEEAIPAEAQEGVLTKEHGAPDRAAPQEERETLLLAKSFYLKDGEEVQKEALRVSRALKELRWGVRPPYLISVMIDDNVGIEANGDTIMADLVEKIEPLGYRFVAVNMPNGAPTAWFKRTKLGIRASSGSEKQTHSSVNTITRLMDLLAKQLEIERKGTSEVPRDEAAREDGSSSLFTQLKEAVPSTDVKTEETPEDQTILKPRRALQCRNTN